MENSVIKVGGMSCQGCVKSVTGALTGVSGVVSVDVSLERGEAAVTFDPQVVALPALRQVIEEAGFDAD